MPAFPEANCTAPIPGEQQIRSSNEQRGQEAGGGGRNMDLTEFFKMSFY
jgi:hypothetical protein